MIFVRLLLFLSLVLLTLTSLSVSISETDALLKFKQSISLGSKDLDSWVPNTIPCNDKAPWTGVMCNKKGIITGLHLPGMGLSGSIDVDALLEIHTIRSITLVNNSFSGPIPGFNRIGHLRALYLSFNGFSGEIPSNYFSTMGSLRKLWLSGNKFSGRIPESLGQIPTLIELHLEQNEFSGPIPAIRESLTGLDVSNNKLEGEIPPGLSKLDAQAFQGNLGLCGQPLPNNCATQKPVDAAAALPQDGVKPPGQKSSSTGWVVMAVIASVVLLALFIRSRQRSDKFDKLGKENARDAVHVRVPSSNRRHMEPSQSLKSASSRRGGPHHGGKGMGDLTVINDERGIFGLADLMKAAAEVLGNGGLGSAYKAVMGNGVSVVVKRMRELNKISKDAFDMEMRRLGRIRHPNILTPLAYHYRKDEKLLVSEYVPKGSLLYILHGDRGTSHSELNWPTRLKIIKGVANGMRFLHTEFASLEVPHGNLKSSNILLGPNYEPVLTDYAFYPLINTTHAVQAMFAYKAPEAILYQQVTPKSDVYCLGIIILEVLTGKFPSQYLSNQKGGIDVVQWVRTATDENRKSELIDPEIATASTSASSLAEMEKLLCIGAICTESNLDERIDMDEAIRRIEEIQV